jgi:hypothetical protein
VHKVAAIIPSFHVGRFPAELEANLSRYELTIQGSVATLEVKSEWDCQTVEFSAFLNALIVELERGGADQLFVKSPIHSVEHWRR